MFLSYRLDRFLINDMMYSYVWNSFLEGRLRIWQTSPMQSPAVDIECLGFMDIVIQCYPLVIIAFQ